MQPPHFWYESDGRHSAPLLRMLLMPLSWIYAAAAQRKINETIPKTVDTPVICVGNLTMGGVGKTPIVSYIADQLSNAGHTPATLSRGYKGRLPGPVQVKPGYHTPLDVGDEPLMLAKTHAAYISKNRIKGAQLIHKNNHSVIVMDDGHQNPSLLKTISLVVVDSEMGFGNKHVFPAGPLREHIHNGLARADAVIIVGSGNLHIPFSGPLFRTQIVASDTISQGPWVAFAGIGKPEKFFNSLRQQTDNIVECFPFPDHHTYTQKELDKLHMYATQHKAKLITTEKDYVRLPADMQANVTTLPIHLKWEQGDEFIDWLRDRLPSPNPPVPAP